MKAAGSWPLTTGTDSFDFRIQRPELSDHEPRHFIPEATS